MPVWLEVHPPLEEPALAAVRKALVGAGVRLDGKPGIYMSAWRAAAAHEAVQNEPESGRYARSPRSTRGATRA
jgi:hypothetical protein